MTEFESLETQLSERLTAVAESVTPPDDAWERLVARLEQTAGDGPVDAGRGSRPTSRRWVVAAVSVAAAAVVVVLVLVSSLQGDEGTQRIITDDPFVPPTAETTPRTTAPPTTTATTVPATTVPATTVPVESEAAEERRPLPDPASLRALTEIEHGDVLIPSYVPDGMKITVAGSHGSDSDSWYFRFEVVSTDESANSSGLTVGLVRPDEDLARPDRTIEDDVRFDIDGQVWSTWDETGVATFVRPYNFYVDPFGNIDEQTVETFVAGLRAGPPEDFPGLVIQAGEDDELTAVDGAVSTRGEVVAEDDVLRVVFAAQSGHACWLVHDNSPEPPNWTAGPDCDRWGPPTEPLLVLSDWYTPGVLSGLGWTDDESASQVRVTSPMGTEIVVPTQGSTAAVNGQFFIFHIEWPNVAYDTSEFRIESVAASE